LIFNNGTVVGIGSTSGGLPGGTGSTFTWAGGAWNSILTIQNSNSHPAINVIAPPSGPSKTIFRIANETSGPADLYT
jgi:hypothetical protein